MPLEEHIGDVWAQNTLNRAVRTGQNVLGRTMARKIDWPEPKEYENGPIKDPLEYTSVDDAFSTVLQFMSQTTRQCQRYYKTNDSSGKSCSDKRHCYRFHSPQYTELQHKNPLQRSEDVHVVVHPGTYAVTAGTWGTEQQQQTHVVNVNQGQSVNLNFCM